MSNIALQYRVVENTDGTKIFVDVKFPKLRVHNIPSLWPEDMPVGAEVTVTYPDGIDRLPEPDDKLSSPGRKD